MAVQAGRRNVGELVPEVGCGQRAVAEKRLQSRAYGAPESREAIFGDATWS
jgi:hypothetical protein